MTAPESRIYEVGHQLLTAKGSTFKFHGWTQSLMNRMMENESFRVASLRFTDVAPALRNDEDFMQHLSAYFGEVGGLKHFIGEGIPGSGFLGKVIAPLARRNIKAMAHSFIAGETVEDGLKNFKQLHTDGLACSLDLLGEAVITRKEADAFMAAYKNAIQTVGEAAKKWPAAKYPEYDQYGDIARANISVKLSALTEHFDIAAHDLTVETLSAKFGELLELAMQYNTYIHIDVEQYHLLPVTMDVFEKVLMDERFKNYPHVGIVCQAYLRDSEAIFDRLITLAKKRKTPFSIRLVKGAYWDTEQALAEQLEWPCPVFDNKEETDASYELLTEKLLKAFPLVRPCIGSHNARSLAKAITLAENLGLERGDVEFQVLHGMAEQFRDKLRDMGYRVRQYCPVGEFIPGMSYLVRRLLENTANQAFVRMHGRSEASIEELLKAPQATVARCESVATNFHNRPFFDFSQADKRLKVQKALENYERHLPIVVQPKINGANSGKGTFEHVCPWANDKTVSHVTLASTKDAEQAITTAKTAYPKWRDMGPAKRADILERAADLCEDHYDELIALQVFEAGKDWLHGDADIAEGIDFMRYYAWQIRNLESRFQPESRWGETNSTIYEPRGVAAVIAPWNFPFAISAGMTCAALAGGNAVCYKPAEQTSATGQKLCEILWQAGVPADVLHFLPGKGEEVGAKLVEHPDVSLIAFTGSREVGTMIYNKASEVAKGQDHLKKCVIEMGGKNALIVDNDADLDEAVPGTVHSAFGFQGQKCSACSRVIVVGSAYEPFVERLKEMVASLRVGPTIDPKYDVGAVIDAEAHAKHAEYIKIGKKDGKLLMQADLPEEANGYFTPPSVFTDLKDGSKLTNEEVFGPVLAVYHAKTVEDAVAMALDSEYALTGGIFSRNPKSIAYAKEHFRVGNLYINTGITGALVGRQPFGGGKMSGTGTNAGGPDYILNFVEGRSISENTMRRGFAPKDE